MQNGQKLLQLIYNTEGVFQGRLLCVQIDFCPKIVIWLTNYFITYVRIDSGEKQDQRTQGFGVTVLMLIATGR